MPCFVRCTHTTHTSFVMLYKCNLLSLLNEPKAAVWMSPPLSLRYRGGMTAPKSSSCLRAKEGHCDGIPAKIQLPFVTEIRAQVPGGVHDNLIHCHQKHKKSESCSDLRKWGLPYNY